MKDMARHGRIKKDADAEFAEIAETALRSARLLRCKVDFPVRMAKFAAS